MFECNMVLEDEKNLSKSIEKLRDNRFVLNYLKVAVSAFEKAILKSECSQWDFNLKFEKNSWNVSLVGSVWTKKRASLNEKIAQRTQIMTEVDIVKKILLRPEDMETVSLDQGHLQNR